MDEIGNVGVPVSVTIFVSTGNSITAISYVKLWIGLKDGDDQGSNYDFRVALYIAGKLVSVGESQCITGLTRNPSYGRAITVPFSSIENGNFIAGDKLSLRVFARIGTTPNGQKCGDHENNHDKQKGSDHDESHYNTAGLRLYYDSPKSPSRFRIKILENPMRYLFLHSAGSNYLLNYAAPTGIAKYKDSASINFSNGNPWKKIGTWTMVLQ
jgi:hypothetical protein